MGINHSKAESFSYAFSGIREAFKKEPNLRTHVGIAILVLIAALFLKFNLMEWVLLTVTIFFVLILELLNTAIESLVNLVSPEIKKGAKVTKDISAAAVLFASVMAVIVGVALFGAKLLALL